MTARLASLLVFGALLLAIVAGVATGATGSPTRSEFNALKARVVKLEERAPVPGPQGPQGIQGPIGPQGPPGPKAEGGEEPPIEEPPAEEPPTGTCTATVSSISAATLALKGSAVVCLTDGAYGSVSLSGNAGGATLTAVNPGKVTVGGISASGSNVTVTRLISGSATCSSGASNVTFDQMAIHGEASSYKGGPCTWKRSEIFGPTGSGEKDSTRCWEGCKGVTWEANLIHIANEDGGHNDGLQGYGSGHGIRFIGNRFVGGLGSQGFFLKDGTYSNVTFADNLIVNRGCGSLGYAGAPFQVYGITPNAADPFPTGHGLVMEHNTIWGNCNTSYFRACAGSDYVVAHNVIDGLTALDDGGSCAKAWAAANVHESDSVKSGAVFRAPTSSDSTGDWRLASGTQGITWDPTARHYGP